jgi:GR25 family glycosyltransferase involved in LPS biosynthesis
MEMFDVFIICPKSKSNRKKTLEKRFNQIGLKPIFVDAIMGEDLREDERQLFYTGDRQNWLAHPMQDNAIGCALSHQKIWSMISQGSKKYGLILEDDALPLFQKETVYMEFFNNIEKMIENVDIVFLSNRRPTRDIFTVTELSETFKLCAVKYSGIGAESYLITRHAAKSLDGLKNKFDFEVDCLLHHWWRHPLSVLHLSPPIFEEDGRASTIGYTKRLPNWPNNDAFKFILRRFNRLRDSLIKRLYFYLHLKKMKLRF